MIERITRLPLRSIWKHEARDFTTWLHENLDILKDIIGFEILNAEKEQSTGNFHVDIMGEDSSGNSVVVENQLEKSDHDHLGKLITYLTAFEAKTAIWIVSEPRQEHINAISWLNESTEVDFYLIKIEAIKIGDSAAAPLLTQIVGPSEEAKQIGSAKKDSSERHKLRYKFWEGLLEVSKPRHKLFASISPTQYNWIGASSGIRGINYTYWITKEAVSLRIYIDRGKDCEEENLNLFNQLLDSKADIEAKFGDTLVWEELSEYRACVIKKDLEIGGWRTNPDKWNEIYGKAIEAMINLEKATRKYISSLKI
jgi:hypothetical protein